MRNIEYIKQDIQRAPPIFCDTGANQSITQASKASPGSERSQSLGPSCTTIRDPQIHCMQQADTPHP